VAPTGWRLFGWIALALGALGAAVLAAEGTGQEGVRAWIRASARASLALFLLAFVARPLRQLWRHPAATWLVRSRRQIGVSFATSHALHLAAIGWFGWAWPDAFAAQVKTTTLVFGSVGYVFTAAMAATSSDAAVRRLGARRWKRLHATGTWVLWAIFLATYGGAAAAGGGAVHGVSAALLVAALGLRGAARWRRRGARAERPLRSAA
jgi:DMSO/TMAO reductase YedYZ heme-binding membrane subunit